MSQPESLLPPDALAQALAVRDLTDPSQGPHAVQRILDAAVKSLASAWRCEVAVHRASPVVSSGAADRPAAPSPGSPPDEAPLPPVSLAHALRTRTTAMLPPVLRLLAAAPPTDVLLACPGVVFRREGGHVRPRAANQVDLWRLRRGVPFGVRELAAMIGTVARAVASGFTLSAVRVEDPHTLEGRQLDVRVRGAWVAIGRCGLVRPQLLAEAGLPPDASGLAMTLDLDRLVMLAKGLDDARVLWSRDPRVAPQMLDLAPFVPPADDRSAAQGGASGASDAAGEPGTLDEVRASIDDLDGRIVKLLAERRAWALRAARLKRSIDPRVPVREEQVVANVRARAREEGIEADLVEGLYRHLMDEFVRLQRAARRGDAGAGGRAVSSGAGPA